VNSNAFVNDPSGALLEREVADRLHSLLAEVAWVEQSRLEAVGGADLAVQVGGEDGRRAVFLVHVKSELRPSAFPAWAAARRRTDAMHVLALPIVSPRLAELCRQHGWSWLDLAGNCWLDAPGVLRIERSGAPPVRRPPRRGSSLKTPAFARVLRVLLSPAHADRGWTQRTLQAATCDRLPAEKPVSLGLVNKVVQHLRDQGFVTDVAAGLRLRDPVGLLSAWREQYRLDEGRRLSFFTLSKSKSLGEAIDRLTSQFGAICAYAAFSAAERQAPQVRQPRTWVYVRADHLDEFVRAAEAKPVDSGENLVVLLPGDPGVFQVFGASRSDGDADKTCTDPVQTYVDLTTLGGRGAEAAQAILEQRLLPAWKQAGLA
jgi:hypothetical protein